MSLFFNTDKIWDHGYFPAYLRIAAELGPAARVCEIGVQAGESLRMWQALFPMGEVTGVDIDPQAVFPPGTERVIMAQDNPRLTELGFFDLIVDDASHDGTLTRKTFDILWPRVNPGGFYVVEDWFFGIKPWRNGGYQPGLLETVQHFLTLLAADGDCESAHYSYGLAVLRKKKTP